MVRTIPELARFLIQPFASSLAMVGCIPEKGVTVAYFAENLPLRIVGNIWRPNRHYLPFAFKTVDSMARSASGRVSGASCLDIQPSSAFN